MGIRVSLEEVITEHHAPYRKLWQTIGTPQIWVMAHYRMGFELTPTGASSLVRVFIDYSLPATAPGSWLGGVHARWCTKRMTDDARRHSNSPTAKSP